MEVYHMDKSTAILADREPLKDYVAWFKMATMEVYHLNKLVAMLTLKRGLHPSHLIYSLDKTLPKSY